MKNSTRELLILKLLLDQTDENHFVTIADINEYFFIDGQAHLIKIADRFLGSVESGMSRNCIASRFPSRFTDMYLNNVHPKMVQMLQRLGIHNGPVFFQGFVDGNTVRFYDPGCRFPGAEYETVYQAVWGLDLMKLMVEFALTGKITEQFGTIPKNSYALCGGVGGMLLPTIRSGEIADIVGLSEIEKLPQMVCYTVRHHSGEMLRHTADVNHLLCEFDFICDSVEEYSDTLCQVQSALHVYDTDGEEMLISPFSVDVLKEDNGERE